MNIHEERERLDMAVRKIRETMPVLPDRAVILGSGLGRFAERLDEAVHLPYAEIPGFPVPTIPGHRGELIAGRLGEVWIFALAGRFHFYEGHELPVVVRPIRVFAKLGVKHLLVTNAAGAVNKAFSPGDLMLITDHLNFSGAHPLKGENFEEFGPRFPDMTRAYSPRLLDLARRIAAQKGMTLREGVYAWLSGPSYETPAEIRALRTLGADAVGMSTVPEVLTAVHAGMDVAGISLITNMGAGILDHALCHEEVTAAANEAAERFESLAEALLTGM